MKPNPNFEPTALNASKLRFYSIGIVAANKPLGSHDVEVTPVEELPMLNGELSAHAAPYSAKAVDAQGQAYSASVSSQVSVKASWLRMGSANRLSSPDVRRGEAVMLYQFGDADKYYWVVLKDDSRLRKLETVIWAISATPDEGKDTNASTSYYVEMSSHTGVVHLHTSTANGEPFAYDMQLNTKDGAFTLTDDAGNFIRLDSAAGRLELRNSAGSHYDMDKGNLTLTMPENITMNAQLLTVNAKAVVNGHTTLNAGLLSGGGDGSVFTNHVTMN